MESFRQFQPAEFFKVQFELQFSEAVVVDLATVLRLRRPLRSAGQYALVAGTSSPGGGFGLPNRFGALFSPPPALDPVARRQFQKGSAAFVLQHDLDQLRPFQRGETFQLAVVLWGGNTQRLCDLAQVIQALGQSGLRADGGRFTLTAIHGEDSSGYRQRLWRSGEPLSGLMAAVRDADWWLKSFGVDSETVQLRFKTPARLMVNQRPLFHGDFKTIFPFILRRVSSMLYTHCHLDPGVDSSALLEYSRRVEESQNVLRWQDWRALDADHGQQPLGGLCGSLDLCGSALVELLPWLCLGSLMNIGKNASYGAGCYELVALPCSHRLNNR